MNVQKLRQMKFIVVGLGVLLAYSHAESRQPRSSAETIQVAAYYFPRFHADPADEREHGKGWTQWIPLQKATPRFPGHAQPKIPAWGYEDESDPRVFEKKIAAAADHGIDAFIFDWYWSGGRSHLEGALQRGYLNASNNQRLKFALIWANHEQFGGVTRPVWDSARPLPASTGVRAPARSGRRYF